MWPRTPHLLSPVTGVPRLAAAPGRVPTPRAGVAGAAAGPDAARSTGGPQWAMTFPPEAGRAPGVCGRPTHTITWPSLTPPTHTPGPV